jgi:hypothetical protein
LRSASTFAELPNKVIACFAETGQIDKIVLYSKKVNHRPDYVALLQHIMRTNPEKGAAFAMQLVNDEQVLWWTSNACVMLICCLFPC